MRNPLHVFAALLLATSTARALSSPLDAPKEGIFLQSLLDSGRLLYFTSSGCARLLDGLSYAIADGKGGVYYSGDHGTGRCTPEGCRLLTSNRLTLAAAAGPSGDIYASGALEGTWHCRPTYCRQASAEPIEHGVYEIQGAYKSPRVFVGFGSGGVFRCEDDVCRKINAPRPDFDASFGMPNTRGRGGDGAVYSLEDHAGEPAPDQPATLPTRVLRSENGAPAVAIPADVACWAWDEGLDGHWNLDGYVGNRKPDWRDGCRFVVAPGS